VVCHFDTDPLRGLTREDAARRLDTLGPNVLPAAARTSAWRLLLAQLKNVLIVILLVAIGLSFLLGHTTEAVAIAVIALFSVVLGFLQEYRAEWALEALRRLSAPHATALRDGEAVEVPSRDLVPGDILLLEAGDVVPADGRLLEAINRRVDEAALTGESSPVGKGVEALPAAEVPLGDRTNLMRRKPHRPGAGIFSRPVVVLMLLGGCWSALVNVGLFAWALATRGDVHEAMTMTFVSLVLIQFCKAYSFRSERHSVFRGMFENRWLNWAVLWELALLGCIVYLPILQAPFGTFPLPLVDWLILVGAALTIVPVLEAAKWVERRGWFGPVE
jgi:magnesium-transporting ATPase (P-type)